MPPIDLGQMLWELFVAPLLAIFCRRPRKGDIYAVKTCDGKFVYEPLVEPVDPKVRWGTWRCVDGSYVRPFPYGPWHFTGTTRP